MNYPECHAEFILASPSAIARLHLPRPHDPIVWFIYLFPTQYNHAAAGRHSGMSGKCSNASEMCSNVSEMRSSVSEMRSNVSEMRSNASEMCSSVSESGEGRDSISSKRWNPLEVFMKLCLASGITRCVPACPNPGRDSLTPTSANRTFRPSLARQGQSIADARGVSVWGGIPSLQKMESIKKSDALTIVANKQLPSRNL